MVLQAHVKSQLTFHIRKSILHSPVSKNDMISIADCGCSLPNTIEQQLLKLIGTKGGSKMQFVQIIEQNPISLKTSYRLQSPSQAGGIRGNSLPPSF